MRWFLSFFLVFTFVFQPTHFSENFFGGIEGDSPTVEAQEISEEKTAAPDDAKPPVSPGSEIKVGNKTV